MNKRNYFNISEFRALFNDDFAIFLAFIIFENNDCNDK